MWLSAPSEPVSVESNVACGEPSPQSTSTAHGESGPGSVKEPRLIDAEAPSLALWLAGATFQQLLQRVVAPLSPRRNTIVKFEYVPEFATGRALAIDERDDALAWATSPAPADAAEGDDSDPDQRSASLMERAAGLAATLADQSGKAGA